MRDRKRRRVYTRRKEMKATKWHRADAFRHPAPRLLVTVLSLLAASASLAHAEAPALDRSALPPGEAAAEAVLRVPETGRYSIRADGRAAGLRLELVDRMAGTIAGTAGTASARLDIFLEKGEYKVRVGRDPAEPVGLAVHAFSEAGGAADRFDVPELTDGEEYAGELHDLELRSWWVRVDPADPVLLLEAQGRCLADAVLWRDGFWETGLRPVARILEPQPGRPVTLLEFNTRLEPGLYLLTCAGGPPRPWAGEVAAEPFSLARGGRYLGELGAVRVTLPERGTASFRVSGRATWVQMEAPGPVGPDDPQGYRLAVAPDRQGASRYEAAQAAVIDAKSASRRGTVRPSGSSGRRWVTLQGPPGAEVEVRWFPAVGSSGGNALLPLGLARPRTGSLLTVLGAAEGGDSLDLTGLLTETWRDGWTARMEARDDWQAVHLGTGFPLRRRFNSLAPASLLLEVGERGPYTLYERSGEGGAPGAEARGRYLLQPMDDVLSGEDAPPIELVPEKTVDLPARLYLLTILPATFGILDFVLIAEEERGRPAGAAEARRLFAAPPPAPGNGFSRTGLAAEHGSADLRLLLVSRGSVAAGLVSRPLPLDLEEPVCLRAGPGEELAFSFSVRRETHLFLEAFSPSPGLDLRVDAEPWRPERMLAEGEHSVHLLNRSGQETWLIIGTRTAGEAADPAAARERPQRPDPARLLPSFSEGRPLWRDFERGGTATFLLSVTEPASYRVTTVGRLAMGLTVRTPLQTHLFDAAQNADGRNAAVTAYLRPGLYLLQASAQGASRGRAGVLLERLGVLPAGMLAEGVTLRRTVPAGVVLGAEVRIERDGDYRLECLGLGRSFSWRLEDAGGWPVGQPVGSGPLETHLAAGTYRYLSAADPTATRRLLSLQAAGGAAEDPSARTARRLPIELDRTYSRIWVEAEGRPEDVFPFSLPAPLQLSLVLSEGMRFRVVDPGENAVAGGLGGEPVALELPAGAYELRVRRVEEDNLAPYQLALGTDTLYTGAARAVACPGSVPVSVGAGGTVELWSRGATEVEAVLWDGNGRVAVRGEPIPDDWNFRLVADLPPGVYLLQLAPPGSGDGGGTAASLDGGAVLVTMIVRARVSLPAAARVLDRAVELGGEVAVLPFRPDRGGVYRFQGEAAEAVSVSVSRDGQTLASGPGPLLLPLSGGAEYHLRYWHAGLERRPVRLLAVPLPATDAPASSRTAAAPVPLEVRESALRIGNPGGVSFRLEDGEAEAGVAASGVAAAGRLLYSPGADRPFEPFADTAVSTAGEGWVVREDGSPLGRLRVAPLALADGVPVPVRIGRLDGGFLLTVPARTAALVRTENAGRPVGLSVSRADSPAGPAYEWGGAAVSPLTSVAAARGGSFRGRLWDADPAGPAGDRRVTAVAHFYPVVSEPRLPEDGRLALTLPPRSAVEVSLAGPRQEVKVTLERGLTAFGWTSRPEGVVDAAGGSAVGWIDPRGLSVTVVNASGRPALCALEAGPSRLPAGLSAGESHESLAGGERPLVLPVSADPGARVYLWGAADAARHLSAVDGKIRAGERLDAGWGPVLSFPGGKGRLEIAGRRGALRAWVARPEAMAAAFAGFPAAGSTAGAQPAPLPPQGAALDSGRQAWSFELGRQAIVCLEADAGGITSVTDRAGKLLGTAAGENSRMLLLSLAAGRYTALVRPFRGALPRGILRLRELAPVDLAADGEGPAALLAPGGKALFRFQVRDEGRVGAGLRSDRDGLQATLLDGRFRPVGSGALLVRSLEPGPWYLLVEQAGEAASASPVRFAPVVFGLEGSRTRIPEDIIRSFRSD